MSFLAAQQVSSDSHGCHRHRHGHLWPSLATAVATAMVLACMGKPCYCHGAWLLLPWSWHVWARMAIGYCHGDWLLPLLSSGWRVWASLATAMGTGCYCYCLQAWRVWASFATVMGPGCYCYCLQACPGDTAHCWVDWGRVP